MKITGIPTHILQSALSQPFAFSQGWVAQRSATLVEVTTDTGTSGWGGAFAQGMEAPLELHDGMVKIPDGPGLGIEVVAETLDRYRVN